MMNDRLVLCDVPIVRTDVEHPRLVPLLARMEELKFGSNSMESTRSTKYHTGEEACTLVSNMKPEGIPGGSSSKSAGKRRALDAASATDVDGDD